MTLPLIPQPTNASSRNGSLVISDGMNVVVESPELTSVALTFIDDVRIDAGIRLTLSSEPTGEPAIVLTSDSVDLDSVAPAGGIRADGKSVLGDADERHGLSISSEGAHVWGATAESVHRGLTTLRQLIVTESRDGAARVSAVHILDGPRFAWRGLSLDVARTFHRPETVRRVIDMCSLHKLNVLHLHLTDDQGWRIEVPSRPELITIGSLGAFGDRTGGYYTLADMSELVAYAAERFVTLVPEIDMPGHTAAIFRAYPELAPAGTVPGESAGGLNLDPESAETWRFVEDVLDAVIPQFTQSAFLHVGGDEAFGMQDEVHAAFVEGAIERVRARGRLALGWQEIARAALTPDDVVQYWMDTSESETMIGGGLLESMVPPELLPLILEALGKAEHDVPSALRQGAKLLISPTSRAYFDRPHAATSADPAQEELRLRVGLPVYPATTIRDGIEWDPADDTPGVQSDEQIAGVEAAIWCETIANQDELEFMLLPRLSGLAEKAWAPRGDTGWSDYAERLAAQTVAWDARGWNWFRSVEVDWVRAEIATR